MTTGNKTNTNDIARTYKALKDNIMRTLSVCTICQVITTSTDYSKCKPINKPKTIIQCYNGIEGITANDYVVVIFTDEDTRANLERINKNQDPVEVADGIKHNLNYGIIISKLRTGE